MKIAYFDCFSGVSGDMLLGAFIDLGLPLEQLNNGLSVLGLDEFHLEASRVEKCGIFGTKLNVVVHEESHHHHRHLGDIVEIIGRSGLDGWVKEKSVKIFENIAGAEGKVHNLPADRVHFHEVGAVDSIVDVVGAVLAVRLLEIEHIYSSPLPMGRGFAGTAHGMVPLPAPATAELLKGVPVYWVDSRKELVTPTGAAILSALATEFGYFPPVRWERIGYGCGSSDRKVPNMLRIFTGWS
ncbi:MAG: nickel pincer cofactor biosynthesis protein LarC [Bacillota bacterium]